MFISPREAGDLCLQMALMLALTVSGMALASTVVNGTERRVSVIDVNRPSLWSAGPVRVDSHERIEVADGREMAAGEGMPCHDTIGLRVSCDLLTLSVSGNF
jgi:hypothetical protein